MARSAKTTSSGPAAQTRNLASNIGFLLSRAHQAVRAQMTTALEGTGLHLGQVVILGVLAQTNDLSQRQLCHLTGIEKSSMVIFIDALEQNHWVERLKHPTDRRAHVVHLTAQAMTRLAPIGARLKKTEADCLSVLNEQEQRTLARLLNRVADHVAEPKHA